MKIGILLTSIGNFGKYGFYNTQEIGLAKALDHLGVNVIVYKFAAKHVKEEIRHIEGCRYGSLHLIPAKKIGKHGLWNSSRIDTNLNALIYFSDTQLAVPSVYRWCKRNHVKLYPYIGVMESHNDNKIKKILADILSGRNINIYRKCHCFAKTPDVGNLMQRKGIRQISHIPVGLDEDLLHKNYLSEDKEKLYRKYGYSFENKILLFVGRLTAEKQPLEMIQLFSALYQINPYYRLMMIGKGELSEDVRNLIQKSGLEKEITLIEEIPNTDIWEIYHIADVFINLNRQEIYGMAILEAMYYECKVVAAAAPGPNSIIQNGITGYLVNNHQELMEKVICEDTVSYAAHKQIENHFLWKSGAEKMMNILTRECPDAWSDTRINRG